MKNKMYYTLLTLVILVFLIAIFAPYITPYDPYQADFYNTGLKPSLKHLFGTDELGRDLFSRVILGARTTVFSALIIIIVSSVIGVSLGLIAGFYGKVIDAVIMRFVDVMLSFPNLIIALAIIGIVGMGILPAIISIIAVSWAQYARVTRSLVLKIKTADYVTAAKTNGTKQINIILRHILPNVMPQIIVTAMLDIGGMILMLSALSFLGFGIQPPTPEWGYMLSEGRKAFLSSPWLLYAPGLAILITVIIFNLYGDLLRDKLDTKSAN